MSEIEVIVFDLDDTLFPESEFIRSGFQAVGDWMSNEYSVFNFFEIAWQLFLDGKRGKIFNLTLEKMGVNYELSTIQKLLQIYREHKPNISLHEDAKLAIDYFQQQSKLGLITDGYLETQKNKVKALAIESNFNVIVYSDLYGRDSWKPSPIPYLKVMETMQCQGESCLYIGDNPNKDFVTAKKLNWTTVQICREFGEYTKVMSEESHEAKFKIKSLLDLKNLL
ncbi:MAG: HAD family hydrolase [Pseudanabaena sp.]|nr:MAG: HAD family hydrolase [Pseudanabaena sp.]